ncbi:MAG: hypothetical protein V4616_04210 [Bacteroidota bacterium]
MRTLLITLLTVVLGFGAFAGIRSNSQLNIRMADFSNYTVTFNNTTYFATEWVKIYNVPPGKHYLRIEENLQTRGRGMQANGRRVIYAGWVTVPNASIVNSRVTFNRNFAVAGIIRLGGGQYGYGTTRNYPQQGGYGNQYPGNRPGGQQGGYQGGYNQGPQGGGYDDDYYQPGDPNNYDYGNPEPGPQGDGAYDDGTFGESQLRATPPKQPIGKTAPATKAQPKSDK